MQRRDFLKYAIASGALYGAGGLPLAARTASAAFANPTGPIFINVTLLGGPDFRHLMPPAYSGNPASYGYRFWRARARAFNIASNPAAWANHYRTRYIPRSGGGNHFGILRTATWLRSQWDIGNVAVVNNVFGSISRDHEHSILVMDQGDRRSGPNDFNKSGWGGRLSQQLGANVLGLSSTPRPFCYGQSQNGGANQIDTSNLISASNTREFGLYEYNPRTNQRWDIPGQLARSLKSYYAGKRQDMPTDSVYREFVDQEQKLREFGRLVSIRLRGIPEPAMFKTLYNWDRSPMKSPGFARQTRNLYDALACSDLLNMRVASMELGDWDTHGDQARRIEANFMDLFGPNRAFDTLWRGLPNYVRNRVVFMFQGEFGRQLVANGEGGTDHGRGNSVLLIGNPVRGGIYGDMFPATEIGRLNDPSADIRGLTSIDQLFGTVCDYMSPGSGNSVFPLRSSSPVESGVNLNRLFS